MIHRTLAVFLMLFCHTVQASSPPNPYVEEICPFICCQYGSWKALREGIKVFEQKSETSKVIVTLKKGAPLKALTGELRTKPGRAVVLYEFEKFKKGDILYPLYYIEEGEWKVWLNDKTIQISAFCARTKEKNCWLKIEQEPLEKWWVKVELNGRSGWIALDPKEAVLSFSGVENDQCG